MKRQLPTTLLTHMERGSVSGGRDGEKEGKEKGDTKGACRTVDGETTFGMIWLCMTHMY